MKRILVPTDFSDTANNAFEAAVLLAKKFSSSVHLYTCLDIPQNWEDLSEEEQNQHPKAKEAVEKANASFESLKNKFPDITVTSSFSGGRLVPQIKECVNKEMIDFLVMGSHGKSGISELLIGSNTQKVVRHIHRPTLVVKKPISSIEFKKVVFASSFNVEERIPFLRFKEVIFPFQPIIHLVGIKTSSFFDAPVSATRSAMEQFKTLCRPLKCTTNIVRNSNIESGIRDIANQLEADIIAISNHNRSSINRLMAISTVESLINHSDRPVLTIDFARKQPLPL